MSKWSVERSVSGRTGGAFGTKGESSNFDNVAASATGTAADCWTHIHATDRG
jgi:hypothetical protein